MHVLHKRITYRYGSALTLLVGLLGCGGDTVGPAPLLSASQAYWALRLDQHAVTLALTTPYNTIQLLAIPLNALGDSLHDIGIIQYRTSDSSVAVSPTGLVTARYTTPNNKPAQVVATLSYQTLTLADTVLIQVTQAPLTTSLAAVSIQPPPSDSAKTVVVATNVIGNKTVVAYATTVSGDTIANPLVYYTSSDPTIATIDRTKGIIHGNVPGHVTFYATTTMYGVTRLDSLPYVIGYPIEGIISTVARTPVGSVEQILAFSPPEITVGVGASVAWSNQVAQPIDVVFDDPTKVQPGSYKFFGLTVPASGGGNIASFQADTTGGVVAKLISRIRARSFPVAGTYHFHSELYQTTGTIVVIP